MRQDHHHVQNVLVQPPNTLFGFKERRLRLLKFGDVVTGRDRTGDVSHLVLQYPAMPGDGALLAVPGQYDIFNIIDRLDNPRHQLHENLPDMLAHAFGQKMVEPVHAENLCFAVAQQSATGLVDQTHRLVGIDGDHHRPHDVKVPPGLSPFLAAGLPPRACVR